MSIAKKLTTIANNAQKVYNAGKKAEYERFWNNHQCDSTGAIITNCRYMFSGTGWRDNNFKPLYAVKPATAEGMFRHSSIINALYEHKDKFDFSNCTTVSQIFAYGLVAKVGVIDTRKTTNASDLNYFAHSNSNLTIVDKLILKTDGSQTFTNFANQAPLKEIRIEGVIGNTITFPSAVYLSRASIIGEEISEEEYASLSTDVQTYNVIRVNDKIYCGGIVAALSTTKTGQTLTIQKKAKEAAFTADEWTTLTATKSNWTFNLV